MESKSVDSGISQNMKDNDLLYKDRFAEVEMRFRSLANSINDVVFTLDTHQRHTGVYGTWMEKLNQKPSDYLGKTSEEILGVELAKVHVENNRIALTGASVVYEWHTELPDGKHYYQTSLSPMYDQDGNVVGIVGIARDITDIKRTLLSLRKSEQKFRLIFENAPTGIIRFDANAIVTDCNRSFIDIFNSQESRLIGLNLRELPDKRVLDAIMSSLKGQLGFFMGEYMPFTGTRSVFMRALFDSETDDNNNIVGGIGIIEDITELRSIEEALRGSEEKYRTIVENANDIIYSVSPEELFTYLSPNWTVQLGYSIEESIGKSFSLYVHPDDVEACQKFLEAVFSTGEQQSGVEYRVRHKDGHWCWHTSNAAPKFDTQGNIVEYIGIAHDITNRKRREELQELMAEILAILNGGNTLQESITSILAAIKNVTGFDAVGIRLAKGNDYPYFAQEGFTNDFILAEDSLLSRDTSGSICCDENGQVNLECTCGLVISGKTNSDDPLFTKGGSSWTNNSFPLLDIPDDQDSRFQPRNNCIHRGYLSVGLIPIRTDKEIVGILQLNDRRKDCFTLEMIHFFEGIGLSIGSALLRLQAEDAIKERNKELDCLYRITALGNDTNITLQGYLNECLVIVPNGFTSPRNTAIRISVKDDVYQSVSFLESNDNLSVNINIHGVQIGYIELFLIKPEACMSPHHFGKDEENLLIAIANHIGNIVRRYLDKDEIAQQYETLKKINAEKDKLFSVIGHDLRGGLSSIIGAANFIQSNTDGLTSQKGKIFIKGISNTAANVYELLENLLEWARFQGGGMKHNPEPCILYDIANDTIDFYSQQIASKGIGMELSIPDTFNVRADINMLQSILRNLVSNAIKFTNRNGRISLNAVLIPDNMVRVAVSDDGIGMDKHIIENLFRIESNIGRVGTDSEPSSGLGLLLCKEFVERNGGEIWAESMEGEGSTFYFTLPLYSM